MTCQSNTIKNTIFYLSELKSARSPYITKMLSTMSNMNHVGPGEKLKNFWLLHPNGRFNHSISLLETNVGNLSNSEEIANTLNNYFSTIGKKKLTKNIEKHDTVSYIHFLNNIISSFF